MARGTWGGLTGERIFRVNLMFTAMNSKCQTGFYLRDIGLNTFDAQDVAAHVRVWADPNFRNILSDHDGFYGVDVRRLDDDSGGATTEAPVGGNVVTSAAALTPAFLTCAVSMKSEIRRRYGQGRMLWPVRTEAWVDGDNLNAAGAAAFNATIAALTARYTGSSLTHNLRLVTAHGELPARPATPGRPARPVIPPSWYDVQSVRLNNVLSSLRSRRVGSGS